MITEKKAANAVGGKTARACDSCMCKRARWYCTADDAFLCQACDASVHSANSLARRHERVRLKTSSLKPTTTTVDDDNNNNKQAAAEKDYSPAVPAWHQGFRRKARTPRGNKSMLSQKIPKSVDQEEPMLMMNNSSSISLPLVPEIGNDETSPDDENEEQLLYRVPIFDPFVAEFCTSVMSNDVSSSVITSPASVKESNGIMSKNNKLLAADQEFGHVVESVELDENYSGVLLPSDMDLTEFAADVETLLGTGLDEDSFCMEGLGLLDSKEEDSTMECYFGNGSKNNIKLEEEEEEGGEGEEDQEFDAQHVDRHHHYHHLQTEIDVSKDYTLDLNFDYDSPTTGEEEEEKAVSGAVGRPMLMMMMNNNNRYSSTVSKIEETTTKSVSLKLNYDAIVSAWASQGSPWTTGDRPRVLKADDCWPDYLGTSHPDPIHHQHHHYGGGDVSGSGGVLADDGGREARVSRYREKRRTRLFSKKIRYEVRKLNAEKRPRMKGRFVKRTSSSSSCFMTGHSVVAAAAAAALPF